MSEAKATALALIDALYNGIDPMTSLQDAVDDARPHADAIRALLEDGAALAELPDRPLILTRHADGRWSVAIDGTAHKAEHDLLTAISRALRGGE